MGWAPVTIRLALPGDKQKPVEAYANPDYPGLAVHEAIDARGLVITHVPSGMVVMRGLKSRAKAGAAVAALHETVEAHGQTWAVPEAVVMSDPVFQKAFGAGRKATRAPRKPRPPRGVRGDAILLDAMAAAGLEFLAGGRKYRYYGKWGGKGEPGIYIRMAKRTARVVNRFRRYETYKGYKGKLEDRGVTEELYYGDIARDPSKAQELVDYYLKRGREFFVVGMLKHGHPG